MNFKYINRKQALGISHPADYIDWALLLVNDAENRGVSLNSENIYNLANDGLQLLESPEHRHMQRIIQRFNAAIDDLSLDFEHSDVEDTVLSKTVQSINSKTRKLNISFLTTQYDFMETVLTLRGIKNLAQINSTNQSTYNLAIA